MTTYFSFEDFKKKFKQNPKEAYRSVNRGQRPLLPEELEEGQKELINQLRRDLQEHIERIEEYLGIELIETIQTRLEGKNKHQLNFEAKYRRKKRKLW